jgi:hypothetical protein
VLFTVETPVGVLLVREPLTGEDVGDRVGDHVRLAYDPGRARVFPESVAAED